jgi:hypothetical protein
MAMSKDLKIDVVEVKRSVRTRTAFGVLLGARITGSTLCQNQPSVMAACTDVVSAGAALAGKEAGVKDAEAKLAALREERDEAQDAFDRCFGFLVAGVEKHALSAGEITALALALADRKTHALLPPLGLDATFDPARHAVLVEVTMPPGKATCLVEVSTNPADPASWRRVPGHGARRSISGYAPGTYWFRALCTRGNDDSDYIDAVSVQVR